MSKPEPEPFMARLLIDSLQHQMAVLTRERDDWRARFESIDSKLGAAIDDYNAEKDQVATLTRERDEARADAKRVWDAGTDEHVVGHWRGIAERLAESRDELKHRARGLEKQIATLTEALENERREREEAKARAYRQARIWEPNAEAYCAAMSVYVVGFEKPVALDAVREPIEYVRCTCEHPGDTPGCEIDHDQIQHERSREVP